MSKNKKSMNIYMCGDAGLKEALDLYKKNEKVINDRFPKFYVARIDELFHENSKEISYEDDINSFFKGREICYVSDNDEIDLAKSSDCIYIFKIGHNGVFGALWNGCEKLMCGCEVFLDRIPIRQEVVEISELFGENPYEADSAGSLLIFSGIEICGKSFQPELIGHTTGNNEKVVIYKDKKRFLTPPARQEKDIKARKSDRRF